MPSLIDRSILSRRPPGVAVCRAAGADSLERGETARHSKRWSQFNSGKTNRKRVLESKLLSTIRPRVVHGSGGKAYRQDAKAAKKASMKHEGAKTRREDKIIVFFLTCACVDYFAKVRRRHRDSAAC